MSSFRDICWDTIRTVDILESIAEITNDYSFVQEALTMAVFTHFGFNARPKMSRDKSRTGIISTLDSILKNTPFLFDQFRELPVRITESPRNTEMIQYLVRTGLYFWEDSKPTGVGHLAEKIYRNTELGFEAKSVATTFRSLLIDEVCKYEYIYRNFREYLREDNNAKYRGRYTHS